MDKHGSFIFLFSHSLQKYISVIHVINNILAYFQPNIKLALFYAYIHGHIVYGAWTGANAHFSHLSPLRKLKRQALRLITLRAFLSSLLGFSSLYLLSHSSSSTAVRSKPGGRHLYGLIQRDVQSFHFRYLQNSDITRCSLTRSLLLPKVSPNYGKYTTSFAGITH